MVFKYCIRLYLVVCFVCVRDVRKRVWWLPMVMMVESWSVVTEAEEKKTFLFVKMKYLTV